MNGCGDSLLAAMRRMGMTTAMRTALGSEMCGWGKYGLVWIIFKYAVGGYSSPSLSLCRTQYAAVATLSACFVCVCVYVCTPQRTYRTLTHFTLCIDFQLPSERQSPSPTPTASHSAAVAASVC